MDVNSRNRILKSWAVLLIATSCIFQTESILNLGQVCIRASIPFTEFSFYNINLHEILQMLSVLNEVL